MTAPAKDAERLARDIIAGLSDGCQNAVCTYLDSQCECAQTAHQIANLLNDATIAQPAPDDVERARDEADGLAATAWQTAQQATAGDDAVASMERITAYAHNLARMLPNIIASTRAAARREGAELRAPPRSGRAPPPREE